MSDCGLLGRSVIKEFQPFYVKRRKTRRYAVVVEYVTH